jgi:glycosyltransferase involved in cell wall biosynthesis
MANLTVVIPVRNEGEYFRRTYEELSKYIPNESQILVVYDNDEDTTVPVLEELTSVESRLRPVKNMHGPGVPNALRSGFDLAEEGPLVVVMGDLSDDLSLIPEMLRCYEAGARVVCPSRYMPGGAQLGGPQFKKVLSRMAGLSLYWLGCLPVRDATNNFRLYDARFLKEARLESTHGFEVALELTIKAYRAGLKIQEIPTIWRDRKWGKSNFRVLRSLSHYLKWWMLGLASVGRRFNPNLKARSAAVKRGNQRGA